EYAPAPADDFAAPRGLATALAAATAATAGTAANAATAGTAANAATAAPAGATAAGGTDPALIAEARTVLAALNAGASGALNNLGVELIAAGQLDRAQAALVQAAALAPSQPAPRGSLALCSFQRGLAARHRGAAAAAASLFASSRDGYRLAIRLAEAAGRADLAGLYRRGLAAAGAEAARDPATH
ncbi:MAG TPA: hypothetical protein VE075_05200, partial [Thermoanaerobaculia bacterium]|nr:hypothetical protein [Thermoanaerobaculia bacterium]